MMGVEWGDGAVECRNCAKARGGGKIALPRCFAMPRLGLMARGN